MAIPVSNAVPILTAYGINIVVFAAIVDPITNAPAGTSEAVYFGNPLVPAVGRPVVELITAEAPVPDGFGTNEAVSVIDAPAANVAVGEPVMAIAIGMVSETFISVLASVRVVVNVVLVNVAELKVTAGTVADAAAGVSVAITPAGIPAIVNRMLVPFMFVEFPLVVFCVAVRHAEAKPSEITIAAAASIGAEPGVVKRLKVPAVPSDMPLMPAPNDVINEGIEVGAI
jgi:hypothetical protein